MQVQFYVVSDKHFDKSPSLFREGQGEGQTVQVRFTVNLLTDFYNQYPITNNSELTCHAQTLPSVPSLKREGKKIDSLRNNATAPLLPACQLAVEQFNSLANVVIFFRGEVFDTMDEIFFFFFFDNDIGLDADFAVVASFGRIEFCCC